MIQKMNSSAGFQNVDIARVVVTKQNWYTKGADKTHFSVSFDTNEVTGTSADDAKASTSETSEGKVEIF